MPSKCQSLGLPDMLLRTVILQFQFEILPNYPAWPLQELIGELLSSAYYEYSNCLQKCRSFRICSASGRANYSAMLKNVMRGRGNHNTWDESMGRILLRLACVS